MRITAPNSHKKTRMKMKRRKKKSLTTTKNTITEATIKINSSTKATKISHFDPASP
jgi:hypothetical protein